MRAEGAKTHSRTIHHPGPNLRGECLAVVRDLIPALTRCLPSEHPRQLSPYISLTTLPRLREDFGDPRDVGLALMAQVVLFPWLFHSH